MSGTSTEGVSGAATPALENEEDSAAHTEGWFDKLTFLAMGLQLTGFLHCWCCLVAATAQQSFFGSGGAKSPSPLGERNKDDLFVSTKRSQSFNSSNCRLCYWQQQQRFTVVKGCLCRPFGSLQKTVCWFLFQHASVFLLLVRFARASILLCNVEHRQQRQQTQHQHESSAILARL